MPRYHVLYNPHAGNGHGTEDTMKLKDIMKDDELVFCDMTTIESYKTFFASLAEDNRVIVAGGDGTLNRFINDTDGLSLCHDVYYSPPEAETTSGTISAFRKEIRPYASTIT